MRESPGASLTYLVDSKGGSEAKLAAERKLRPQGQEVVEGHVRDCF